MLNDLSPDQRELAQYMSELSEKAHAASWMHDLEVDLWRAVQQGPFRYGRLELTAEHIQRLLELSTRCGGWIYLHDTREELFVSFGEWTNMVSSRR
jgi:hypothetical protein